MAEKTMLWADLGIGKLKLPLPSVSTPLRLLDVLTLTLATGWWESESITVPVMILVCAATVCQTTPARRTKRIFFVPANTEAI